MNYQDILDKLEHDILQSVICDRVVFTQKFDGDRVETIAYSETDKIRVSELSFFTNTKVWAVTSVTILDKFRLSDSHTLLHKLIDNNIKVAWFVNFSKYRDMEVAK